MHAFFGQFRAIFAIFLLAISPFGSISMLLSPPPSNFAIFFYISYSISPFLSKNWLIFLFFYIFRSISSLNSIKDAHFSQICAFFPFFGDFGEIGRLQIIIQLPCWPNLTQPQDSCFFQFSSIFSGPFSSKIDRANTVSPRENWVQPPCPPSSTKKSKSLGMSQNVRILHQNGFCKKSNFRSIFAKYLKCKKFLLNSSKDWLETKRYPLCFFHSDQNCPSYGPPKLPTSAPIFANFEKWAAKDLDVDPCIWVPFTRKCNKTMSSSATWPIYLT